ncbi:uncharacterized protein BT62DRAFT_1072486 [Guyanagaster necrorhizus]|uniref:Pentatricopeptide repeat-containing protein n=1 Tax=Guyanagaster necrorhizus TaxID=856835 RepID=A0A9P7W0B9_9AGAR|nr:uncharacterized protein BT62DRAFT_1072486 [Guyanagaster necrorhizus MCA 3950]KAG7450403.1 hypothetical protein BT62DRAFT_1072486 [Guyanagaster necrorhizus MCA 3950]
MLRRTGLLPRPYLDQTYHFSAGVKHSRLCPSCIRFLPTVATARRADGPDLSHFSPALLPSLHSSRSTDPDPSLLSHSSAAALLSHLISNTPTIDLLSSRVRQSSVLSTFFSHSNDVRLLSEEIARNTPRHAPSLIHLALVLGCSLHVNVYECTSHHLAMEKHWDTLLAVVLAATQHVRLTTRLLNWRVRALLQLKDYASLEHVLDEFVKYSVKPNRRTYHLILSGYIQNGDLSRSKDILHKMESDGITPDAFTYSLLAIYYRTLGPNSQVQDVAAASLDAIPKNTATSILNSLLRMHMEANDTDGIISVLAQFSYHHILPIITVVTRMDPTAESPFLLSSIMPDAATYATSINYMASRRDISGAMHLLHGMLSVGLSPRSETITALLHVLFIANDHPTAIRLVAAICKPESASFFKALMTSSSHHPLPLDPQGIQPHVGIFNALLKGILRLHGLNGAVPVLQIMYMHQIRPNSSSLEILISHLVVVERTPPHMVSRVIQAFVTSHIHPNLRHLHVILSSIIRHERYLLYGVGWNRTAARFSPSRSYQDLPFPQEDVLTGVAEDFDPVAGISPPRNPSYDKHLRPFLDSLASRNTRSDSAALALRLKRDATRLEFSSSQAVFDTLLRRGFMPNEYHYSALMEGYSRSGDLESAKNLLDTAVKAGLKPNALMFTILIVGYAREGNPKQSMETFIQMITSGIRPDVPSIDAVASAFFAVGAYKAARQTLMSLWHHIEPFPAHLQEASLREIAVEFRLLETKNNRGKLREGELHRALTSIRHILNSHSAQLPAVYT